MYKNPQKLVLGPQQGPQRRAEKRRNQTSCATGGSSHGALAQSFPNWGGHKGHTGSPSVSTLAAPLHPPKTCPAVLSRHMHIWPTTASFFLTLKMPPIHSFLPPFPLPLPSLRQCPSSLLPLPNSNSSYTSYAPSLSPALTVMLPSQNVPT